MFNPKQDYSRLKKPVFVIEHLDDEVYDWSLLEYKHISSIVGKEHSLITNVKAGVKKDDLLKVETLGFVVEDDFISVLGSILNLGFRVKGVCVLDPRADKTLMPDDKNYFDFFVFGGILGNNPAEGRTELFLTKKLLRFCSKNNLNCCSKNLGKEQMPTDTAVHVTKLILDGTPLSKLSFVDKVVIPINNDPNSLFSDEVVLEFRHLVLNGEPVITPGLKEYLKRRNEF